MTIQQVIAILTYNRFVTWPEDVPLQLIFGFMNTPLLCELLMLSNCHCKHDLHLFVEMMCVLFFVQSSSFFCSISFSFERSTQYFSLG
jgi:hypothetical protein